jgi:thiol:disulfide interchange protein DsbC
MTGRNALRNREVSLLSAAVCAALLSFQAAATPPTKARVEAALPGIEVQAISEVPAIAGLYEVIDADGQFVYVDAALTVALPGEMFDLATHRSLSQENLARLHVVNFDSLPLNLAIKRVKGLGRRRMAVFADPDCPYCTQLEKTLGNIDDVTIFTFIYPLDDLHPQASVHAQAIWCAPDPAIAWQEWQLKRRDPPAPPVDCHAPLQEIGGIASNYNVRGTPSLVFASGRTTYGSLPAAEIEKYLDERPLPVKPVPAGAPGR